MKTVVVIPFRDRGIDPRRAANLDVVQAWWFAHGFDPQIVDDGLEGSAQFNRHRAYNRAVSRNPDADVFVFTEADMLISPDSIRKACGRAIMSPGLVVPFTQYRYLSDETTARIRDLYHDEPTEKVAEWWGMDRNLPGSVFQLHPESTMDNGKSIGAVNVVSAETLRLTGGFTEMTSGNWYDDRIIEEAFAYLTNPTRFIEGPAVHLYHLPGHSTGNDDHLTDEDIAATEWNKKVLRTVRLNIRRRNPGEVRRILGARA